jgi:hypothetical protein
MRKRKNNNMSANALLICWALVFVNPLLCDNVLVSLVSSFYLRLLG